MKYPAQMDCTYITHFFRSQLHGLPPEFGILALKTLVDELHCRDSFVPDMLQHPPLLQVVQLLQDDPGNY